MRLDQGAYFETTARAERLQLLMHLVHNATESVYLRAPSGAGKRRLVGQLVDQLDGDFSVVTIDAGEPVKPIASLLRQLNLPPESAEHWPQRLVDDLGERQALIVVERADHLSDLTREPLAPLGAAGLHLLLVGEGGGANGWPVQFVDLPPFELADSAVFLRSKAGPAASRITDEFVAAAHGASEGLPGLMLDALADFIDDSTPTDIDNLVEESVPPADEESTDQEIIDASAESAPAEPESEPEPVAEPQRQQVRGPKPMDAEKVMRKQAVPLWVWAAGTVGAVLLLTVLVFQDAINSAIDSDSADSDAAVTDSEPANAVDLAIPPLVPEEAAAVAEDTVPPISLPEIGAADSPQTQDEVPLAEAKDDPTERDQVLAATPVAAEQDAEVAGSEAGTQEVDPLDAVMSDALAAEAKPTQNAQTSPEAGPQLSPLVNPSAESQVEQATQPSPAIVSEAPDMPAPTEELAEKTLASSEAPKPTVPETPPTSAQVAPKLAEVATEPEVIPAPVEAKSPQPAPVEDRTRPPGQAAPVVERRTTTVSAATASTPTPAPTRAAQGGDAWLESRSPERYTLQLVGARQRDALDKFVKDHGISQPYAVFERQMSGSAWYSLVSGDYADRDAAVAARERLPQALNGTGVWPRTFGSIREAR